MKPELIKSSSAFETLCEEFTSEPLLAVDTEFFRETTYYPHLGLVQLASPHRIACIDPLAFDAREGLATLLLNLDITKIFHSCIQDFEVLYRYLGKLPQQIVDTQIAAAMLGEHEQIGYATLVELKMGVQLEKSQTRTNWLKRPLTSRQIEYAGEDVLYLIPMYQKLLAGLTDKNREHWLKEDCNRLSKDKNRFTPDMQDCWKRVKGTSKLQGVQASVCQAVAQWREQIAMQKDLTRRKALPDDIIIQIATLRPDNSNTLKKIGRIHKILSNEELESLTMAIQKGLAVPEEQWPSTTRRKPSADEKTLLKRCLELLQSKAEQLGIAPSILCSRKDVEKMIAGHRDIRVLDGWRRDCIGNELLAQISA
jgi:ribonuclease D